MQHPAIFLVKTYLKDPQNWLRNISWRLPKTLSSKTLIFVVGSPRSGTTLLQRILAVHDSLFSISKESSLFSFQNIFRRNHFALDPADVDHLFQISVDSVDFFDRAVTLLEAQNQNRTFVEKTPQHVHYLPFLLKHFPKAQVVHIYRDGRDCYCSSLSHPHIPQRRSVRVFANYWKRCIQSAYLAKESPRLYHLCYENLAMDPIAELSNLMSFLGYEFQLSQIEPRRLSSDPRSQQQHFSKLNQVINNSSCGRWRQEMTLEDVRRFEQIAGHELRQLGYSV